MVKYSQSYIRAALDVDACPAALKFKFIDKIKEKEDDETRTAKFNGRYFEWHLLGATRDGMEPVFRPNEKARYTVGPLGEKIPDYRPKEELDLIELIQYAKTVLKNMGLNPAEGEKQLKIQVGDKEGHLDWVTKDFQQPERKAIYDVKWTGTKVDDHFNGWADFSRMDGERFQATHYIKLYKEAHGEYIPFYFIVFGKSGWIRVIKVILTDSGAVWHNTTMINAREKTAQFEARGWPERPAFNKCIKCGYLEHCKNPAIKPDVEVFLIE